MAYSGNKALNNAYYLNENSREIVPPILHFSKIAQGKLVFNGLTIIDKLEKDTFNLEDGKPIDNLKFRLKVLMKIPLIKQSFNLRKLKKDLSINQEGILQYHIGQFGTLHLMLLNIHHL